MAQPQLLQVKLSRFDAQPWGFRLQGGVDFAAPLLVQKVNGGSLAEQAGLVPGDAVIKINDVDVFNLRHKDAQDIVVRSGNNFVVTIQRGGSTWRPHVTPTGQVPQPNSPYLQTVTKTSLAHKQPQDSQHIGCGYNNAARPFANGGDGSVKSIVNKQYNTPVGIYSDESIAETLSAQAEVLAGGVLGVNFKKNEKEYQAEKSEVLKFLREEETGGHSTPAFNNYQDPQQHQQQQQFQQQQQHQQHQHQHQQQQQHQQHHHQPHQHVQHQSTRHVNAPINTPKPPSTGGLPTGQNICNDCERLITGVFVRIKDKNLHVECFKCATCGTSLKNQGYYNFNNKLYCDIHAKLAALNNPPAGTEGYVPVPIKPNTALSANTISSALSAHGFNGVPVANGNSTPAPAPVNQGYARPFGAAPPSAAPKSPVSFPPQQQQWGGASPQKPMGNPYATLPRTNVGGQQAPCTNSNNANATLPRKPHAKAADADARAAAMDAYHSQQAGAGSDDATAMLTESIGKINMGNKMDNFMAEAGKIISSMLEARLAGSSSNNSGTLSQPLSNSDSLLSLRSNSSSNLSKSPMVVRKRFELDDFKDLDPTEPVTLKPVVALQQQITLNTSIGQQKAQPQVPHTKVNDSLRTEMPMNHPMGKVLDICDNKRKVINRAGKPAGGTSPLGGFGGGGGVVSAMKHQLSQPQTLPTAAPPPLPPQQFQQLIEEKVAVQEDSLSPMETVVYRNNSDNANKRSNNAGVLSTHAMDRRSYIEPTASAQAEQIKDGPVFSISVKALGAGNSTTDANAPMSAENEEVVSQLLKDGKRPICCQCNAEITKGPFITALGRIWCPEHFICVNANCRRPLQDIGFVEEKGDLYCEYCFEKYLAPSCSRCGGKIKGDCLNAIGKQFHPECFTCGHCGKVFGNTPFFLEDGNAYCETDWNELFTTKCFACGFPVEAGDRWVEALNHNYHSQCFNCSYCKQNLEGQSFYNKGGRPFCKNHAR